MLIDFVIPGEPPRVTAQQKGERVVHGRVVHYEKSAVKTVREMYAMYARAALPHGWEPMKGPVRLYVAFRFGTDERRKEGRWKTTRPDTDNMAKALKDAMNGIVYADDSQVASEQYDKYWVRRESAGIHVRIEEMEEKHV